jgi:hypothetical protein
MVSRNTKNVPKVKKQNKGSVTSNSSNSIASRAGKIGKVWQTNKGAPVPKTSLFRNFQRLKDAIVSSNPNLHLITTEDEFANLLRLRGKTVPSALKLCVRNSDGKTGWIRSCSLVNGHSRLMTATENEEWKSKLSRKNRGVGGVYDREIESIIDIKHMFLSHDLVFEDLTVDVECGTADGYIRIPSMPSETSFIGVQVTRANAGVRDEDDGDGNFKIHKTKDFKINKSKEKIQKQVCELGFLFFAMMYAQGVLLAILFLSPSDKKLIESLPNFKNIVLSLGNNGYRAKQFKKGSLGSKLSNNIYYMADCDLFDSHGPFDIVAECVADPAIRRHTYQEFLNMLTWAAKVEARYVERLKSCFPDLQRMRSHAFGDVVFSVGGCSFTAELKLAQKQFTAYTFVLYRKHHVLDNCIRDASVVFGVVTRCESKAHQLSSDPEMFQFFVGFPTRTMEGRPNMLKSHDGSARSTFAFYFDRVTRLVESKHTELPDFIVVVPGEELTDEQIDKLKSWASRPFAAIDSLPSTGSDDSDSSDSDSSPMVSSAVSKTPRAAAANAAASISKKHKLDSVE